MSHVQSARWKCPYCGATNGSLLAGTVEHGKRQALASLQTHVRTRNDAVHGNTRSGYPSDWTDEEYADHVSVGAVGDQFTTSALHDSKA
jgi:hypothetical protein